MDSVAPTPDLSYCNHARRINPTRTGSVTMIRKQRHAVLLCGLMFGGLFGLPYFVLGGKGGIPEFNHGDRGGVPDFRR
jgi:hypothetical protein